MAKNSCRLNVSLEGEVLTARLCGELDHHGAVAVRTHIDSETARLCPRCLVLDLSALDFMDSSGLGLVMGRYALMQKRGGEFIVRGANERVLKIFHLAGLERMVNIENSNKGGNKNETQGK